MNALAATGLDRRRLIRGLGVLAVLAVGAAVVVHLTAGWSAVPAEALGAFHLDARPLAAAWALQTAGWLVVVDTWRRMLARTTGAVGATADGVTPPDAVASVSPVRHLQVYAYTSLTQVLPGSFWHPASRVVLYRRLGVSPLAVGAAVAIEWLLLGIAGLVLHGLAAPFARGLPPAWLPWMALAALAGLAALHPAAFRPAMARAAGWLGQPAPPAVPTRVLAGWLARELVVLGLSGVALYCVMLAVSPAAALADALSAWGLAVAVASLLAWLPATALFKDAGMVVLLTPLYAAAGFELAAASVVALGVTLVWRLWSLAVLVSWAGLAALAGGRRWRPEGAPTGPEGATSEAGAVDV